MIGGKVKDMMRRKPMRLRTYDYRTNGAYPITICTQNREKILSHIMTVGEGTEALPYKRSLEISNPSQRIDSVAPCGNDPMMTM